ncbi:MAG: DNA polymerase III subunit gamma/tau [Proteobacteria bacterium]|nr:MAG: DNA polymerase III subunit gamma/tau [Pseudomonadota bacterium]
MTYQVLARKWRPRTFEEMVGQEHVVKALINALDNDRLHHAFLFTGTRGVGKTTVARILAKSLNCEQGVSSKPCGECATCREVDQGRFIDLIEVDAASRTKVEDTRELMDNVQYAPTRGRYKVYLIDEVHMLSTHSFNALLKTLEEPPPHVKFLLATTDPQKVPVTVLSRCLQFSLKRLPAEMIVEYLQRLLGAEEVCFDQGALVLIARAADGSMRDALSLLDQAIAHGGGELRDNEVRMMLGTIEQTYVFELLRQIVAGNGQALLEEVQRIATQAPDFGGIVADMITVLQRIALAQVVPDAIDDLLGDRDAVMELAEQASPEEVQLFYQIALNGRRDLPLAPEPRSGFEMILLRMLAFRPVTGEQQVAGDANQTGRGERSAVRGAQAKAPLPAITPAGESSADAVAELPPAPRPQAPTNPNRGSEGNWKQIVDSLRVGGMVKELAMHCSWVGREGSRVHLMLDPANAQLRSESLEKRLAEALQTHLGEPVRLEIEVGNLTQVTPAQERARDAAQRQAEAEKAVAEDPNVQALQDVFSAQIRDGSTRPLNDSH